MQADVRLVVSSSGACDSGTLAGPIRVGQGYAAPGPGSVTGVRGGVRNCVQNEKRVKTKNLVKKKEKFKFCGK